MGENEMVDVPGETRPSQGIGPGGLRGSAWLFHGRKAFCLRWSVNGLRRVEVHGRHRAASRGQSRLLRPDFEDGHRGSNLQRNLAIIESAAVLRTRPTAKALLSHSTSKDPVTASMAVVAVSDGPS